MSDENIKNFNNSDVPVVSQLAQTYRLVHRAVSPFPKPERYSLGEKIENLILRTMKLAITANLSSRFDRENSLVKASAQVETAKILVRLAHDLDFIPQIRYLAIERDLMQIGRQLAGWTKFVRGQ